MNMCARGDRELRLVATADLSGCPGRAHADVHICASQEFVMIAILADLVYIVTSYFDYVVAYVMCCVLRNICLAPARNQ